MTSSIESPVGYLELVVGPMYSGKTSYLVELYKKNKYIGKKIICLNYIADVRYCTDEMSTHDLIKIPCVFVKQLGDIWTDSTHPNHLEIRDCDIVLINEGQFFGDLKQMVLEMVEGHQKSVYISGLDGDYCRGVFGDILGLIPYCDNVVKKTALCAQCRDGTAAPFSHRISDSKEQVLIGTDIYEPLCRRCYLSAAAVAEAAATAATQTEIIPDYRRRLRSNKNSTTLWTMNHPPDLSGLTGFKVKYKIILDTNSLHNSWRHRLRSNKSSTTLWTMNHPPDLSGLTGFKVTYKAFL